MREGSHKVDSHQWMPVAQNRRPIPMQTCGYSMGCDSDYTSTVPCGDAREQFSVCSSPDSYTAIYSRSNKTQTKVAVIVSQALLDITSANQTAIDNKPEASDKLRILYNLDKEELIIIPVKPPQPSGKERRSLTKSSWSSDSSRSRNRSWSQPPRKRGFGNSSELEADKKVVKERKWQPPLEPKDMEMDEEVIQKPLNTLQAVAAEKGVSSPVVNIKTPPLPSIEQVAVAASEATSFLAKRGRQLKQRSTPK